MPARGREAGLGRRSLDLPENVRYGQTEVCSEVGRLVEATDPLPARMQRHGHHTIGVAQYALAV